MNKSPRRQGLSPRSQLSLWLRNRLSRSRRACARVGFLVSLAADGAAGVEETREIEAHLVTCPACRAMQATCEMTRLELGSRPKVAVPKDLESRLMAALEAEKRREDLRMPRAPIWTPLRLGLVGTSLAAACAIGIVALVNHPTRPAGSPNAGKTLVASLPAKSSSPAQGSMPLPAAPFEQPVSEQPPVEHPQLHERREFHIPTGIQPSTVAKAGLDTIPTPVVNHSTPIVPIHKSSGSIGTMVASLPKHSPASGQPPADHSTLPPDATATPQPAHTSSVQPVIVASGPPSSVSPSGLAAAPVVAAAYEQTNSHIRLLGTLRQLALNTQDHGAEATVSLASSVDRHPSYSSTVSMVSSTFR